MCDIFQRDANMAHLFSISTTDYDCAFNHTICMDLRYLDGEMVLHAVYKDEKLTEACFLVGESTTDA